MCLESIATNWLPISKYSSFPATPNEIHKYAILLNDFWDEQRIPRQTNAIIEKLEKPSER